jgi:Major Facilitator Superfamily
MFTPFVFLLPIYFAVLGMVLWGIGQSTQNMLLQALVAGVLPDGKRNLVFGLYYAGYGLGWLLGAATAGFLYQESRVSLVVFAVSVQSASLPVFLLARLRT